MAQEPPADAPARETERQMTDEERFALLIGLIGSHWRFPSDAVISRGYRAPSRKAARPGRGDRRPQPGQDAVGSTVWWTTASRAGHVTKSTSARCRRALR
jgi:hypothetical protein